MGKERKKVLSFWPNFSFQQGKAKEFVIFPLYKKGTLVYYPLAHEQILSVLVKYIFSPLHSPSIYQPTLLLATLNVFMAALQRGRQNYGDKLSSLSFQPWAVIHSRNDCVTAAAADYL